MRGNQRRSPTRCSPSETTAASPSAYAAAGDPGVPLLRASPESHPPYPTNKASTRRRIRMALRSVDRALTSPSLIGFVLGLPLPLGEPAAGSLAFLGGLSASVAGRPWACSGRSRSRRDQAGSACWGLA